MEIWLEKKEQLNESELKEMHKLRLTDYEYYYSIMGNWEPAKAVDPQYPIYLAKAKKAGLFRDSTVIVGWIYFTNDKYRVSHSVGRLDGFDNYWHSFNTYVVHIYTLPSARSSETLYDVLLAEVEEGRQNIWADIYSDELVYKRVLKSRGYAFFKSFKSHERVVETWYKNTRMVGFNSSDD